MVRVHRVGVSLLKVAFDGGEYNLAHNFNTGWMQVHTGS